MQTGRKHCGERRNCSLRAISPFLSVFERLVSQGRQKVSLCVNGLINQQNKYLFNLKVFADDNTSVG